MATYKPLVKTLIVPCNQQEAFDVFVQDMGTWWPLTRFSASAKYGKESKSLQVEAKLGGKITETGADDSEHLWGTITAYDPYQYVRMNFHIGLPEQHASLVEVRFTTLDAQRTFVELTQSEWERFGEFAEMMYNGYPKGWVAIFDEAYLRACGGKLPATERDDQQTP